VAHFLPFDGKEPWVDPDAFVAPTAVLIGDVVVEEGASVWFGAVLRGDFDRIVVGAGSSVQDNCVVHTNEDLPTIIGLERYRRAPLSAGGVRDRGRGDSRHG
jgi:carbonic anhydrase/acetyltransferase-like protein (isoleucine patch superfamily)